MFRDLVLANRSYRRFKEEAVPESVLRELIDLARQTPSAANLQPLKYILSYTSERNALIFPNTAWAGYLKDWGGPKEGERPSAYIIVLCDTEISKGASTDTGIAAQTILLGAVEKGLGGCMIGALNRESLRDNLNIPNRYDIALVIALGRPAETVVVEAVGSNSDIKYYRDELGKHHVPKRSLDDVIISL